MLIVVILVSRQWKTFRAATLAPLSADIHLAHGWAILRSGDALVPDEAAFVKTFFMDADHVREMDQAGMAIWAHTMSHAALDTLGTAGQGREIKQGSAVLADLLGRKSEIFSYPHGRYTEGTLNILKAEGFRYGVTLEVRDVAAADDPLRIPRYDTNDREDEARHAL